MKRTQKEKKRKEAYDMADEKTQDAREQGKPRESHKITVAQVGHILESAARLTASIQE